MTLTDDFIAAPTKELACQLAAQAWCTPETSDIIMNTPLAWAFADILLAVANARDFAVGVTMQSMVKRCEELDAEGGLYGGAGGRRGAIGDPPRPRAT